MIRNTGKTLKLPPNWTDRRAIGDLPLEARWHFLGMLVFCASSKRYDGVMPMVWAERASDMRATRDLLATLAQAGLIEIGEDEVRIVDVDEYMPRSDARAAAIKRDGTHLLYRIFDGQDDLLYIGRTWNLKDRFRHHARVQPWWNEVARHSVETFELYGDLCAAEMKAIQAECPRYNHQYNDQRNRWAG